MAILLAFCACQSPVPNGPYFATGIKIGEVSQKEAIVWVRLTQNPQRVGTSAPMPTVQYEDPETGELKERKGFPGGRPDLTPIVTYPEGYHVDNIEGAAPGIAGKAKVKYRLKDSQHWNETEWKSVNPEKDYTTQFTLGYLQPGREYELLVYASPMEAGVISDTISGGFKTAPAVDESRGLNFILITCTSYDDAESTDGYALYSTALKMDPEFFVHTGDIIYYDGRAKNKELARWHWERMYSYPNNIEFHRQVTSYFMKDDHDTWMDDAYPGKETKFMGDFTFEQGLEIFLEQVPMSEKTYRTFRWGKDLQIWMVEGRDYRSQNPMPDGPDKTIWGQEQIDWFKETVENSDATFKLLTTPTPMVGPDREAKNDNHANDGFQHEGQMLREFLVSHNMISVCGDRHWQFVSKDAETGLLEFGTGAGSDAHAGGWEQGDVRPEHLYLNVVGGFLEGKITYSDGHPTLTFTHYDPYGKVLNEHAINDKF